MFKRQNYKINFMSKIIFLAKNMYTLCLKNEKIYICGRKKIKAIFSYNYYSIKIKAFSCIYI